jgi:acyl dehydratase
MSPPLIIPSVAALHEHAGEKLGHSGWIAITQERIDTFADATGDHQWIHCDVERARIESPFKTTIAHGYLTLSLVPTLLAELVTVEGCETVINTGVEKVRLSTPVLSGARVRMSATLRDTREVPRGGVRATFQVRFEVDGETKPACHGSVTYVYFPAVD